MAPSRSLSSVGLSPSIVVKLTENGFINDADLNGLKPSELSEASSLSLKESAEVLRLSSTITEGIKAKSLKQMLDEQEDISHIVTVCESLDTLLGGGISLGTITEVSGVPGIGKTQLCLQACVSVQIPQSLGGAEGEAVYIDTEGSFSALRLKEICDVTTNYLNKIQTTDNVCSFTTESVMKSVYYCRCHSHLELMATVKHFPHFISEHPKIKLIVVDSVAFPFRHDFTDMVARTSLLCALTQDLIQQATRNNLAVLVTNQMTTKVLSFGGSELVPSLGDSWGHCPTIRLYLHWTGGIRTASLVKSPNLPNGSVKFQITSGGFRDRISPNEKEDRKRKLEET